MGEMRTHHAEPEPGSWGGTTTEELEPRLGIAEDLKSGYEVSLVSELAHEGSFDNSYRLWARVTNKHTKVLIV